MESCLQEQKQEASFSMDDFNLMPNKQFDQEIMNIQLENINPLSIKTPQIKLDHQMELSPSCLMRKHAEVENRMSPHGKVLDYDFSSVMHECEPF